MTDAPLSSPWLVSTDWLADALDAPDLVVVDASWHLPTAGRDAKAEYRAGHIPGAVFFDIDAIADTASGLPHMLPDPASFAAAVGALGIGDNSRLVVYDSLGLFSAPRVWWTFQTFGTREVFILDGGLPKWQAEGRPLESGVPTPAAALFTPRFDAGRVATIDEVAGLLATGTAQVADARSGERFRGEAPEPRAGLRAGHMPGARNLPVGAVVRDGRLAEPAAIRAAVAAAGLDPERPIVTSCGSGVTASVIWLALDAIGATPKALYDGSWSEWGASDQPVATGPAD